jgi:predicted transcriptional regulator
MWNNDPGKVRAIINALSDEYSMKIIASTISEAKSPEQISHENNIPVSTCYRRIHDLVALSIIQVSKIDLEDGKKSVLYKSVYKDILVKFENNELTVDLVYNTYENRTAETSEVEEDKDSRLRSIIVLQDCDLCQSKGEICKIFVTGDSRSYLTVCRTCEKRMHDRNTIRAIETLTRNRLAEAASLAKANPSPRPSIF